MMDETDRKYLDLQFKSLETRLDRMHVQFADHESRLRAFEKMTDVYEAYRDHEMRLRTLEKQSPWQWIVQALVAIAAAMGIKLGVD